MSSIEINNLQEKDFPKILVLLKECDLPVSDINFDKQEFLVAEINSEIVGSIALEKYGKNGILRSFAVRKAYRNQKIGEKLYNKTIALSKSSGIEQLYLLTTTAEQYFKKVGWKVIDRTKVPEEISSSTEFASVCPSISICMKSEINLYE